MDKYAVYVVIVYAVTLLILGGYLGWMWWRLRAVRDDQTVTPR